MCTALIRTMGKRRRQGNETPQKKKKNSIEDFMGNGENEY
jgi:hypothetical protein